MHVLKNDLDKKNVCIRGRLEKGSQLHGDASARPGVALQGEGKEHLKYNVLREAAEH